MQSMNIVYSSDNNYAQHLGASIYSLLSHNSDIEIVIYVIDNGISKDNKEYLHHNNIHIIFPYSTDKLDRFLKMER